MCPECADEYRVQRKQEEVKRKQEEVECRNAELTQLIWFEKANKKFLRVSGILYGIGVLTFSLMPIIAWVLMGLPTIPFVLVLWKKTAENMPTSYTASTSETLFGDTRIEIKKNHMDKFLVGPALIFVMFLFSFVATPILMIKTWHKISKAQKRIEELGGSLETRTPSTIPIAELTRPSPSPKPRTQLEKMLRVECPNCGNKFPMNPNASATTCPNCRTELEIG